MPSTFPVLDRTEILQTFPWCEQPNQEMVIGTDLDAILSSVLAHHVKGWEIVGFYDLVNIYSSASNEDLYKAVWLDLDISHPNIRSIGHHILGFDDDLMPAHCQSLNPNLLRGMSRQNYGRKYPLATFHFLCWLWEIEPPTIHPMSLPLYWLPDSTYINAQETVTYSNGQTVKHYRGNVLNWLKEGVPVRVLIDSRNEINTAAFEERIKGILALFALSGWPPKPGRSGKSNHLGLSGGQCSFAKNLDAEDAMLPARINALCQRIAEITGWNVPACPAQLRKRPGSRTHAPIAVVRPQTNIGLSQFIQQHDIFSYVFPRFNEINYTVFGDVWQP